MSELFDLQNEHIEVSDIDHNDESLIVTTDSHEISRVSLATDASDYFPAEFSTVDSSYDDIVFTLGGNEDIDIFATQDQTNEIWSDFLASPADNSPYAVNNVFSHQGFVVDSNQYQEINSVYGTPARDMLLFDQQDSQNSCAVATTNMMFRSLGIYDFNESALEGLFTAEGIYDPASGTTFRLIDDVLNSNGVEGLGLHAKEMEGFDIDVLKSELDAGNSLLVALDAGEINLFSPPGSGHAVLLTGIVETSDGTIAVINDPGYEGGAGREIPWETFENATAWSGNSGISLSRV
jgi:hypothetical protein